MSQDPLRNKVRYLYKKYNRQFTAELKTALTDGLDVSIDRATNKCHFIDVDECSDPSLNNCEFECQNLDFEIFVTECIFTKNKNLPEKCQSPATQTYQCSDQCSDPNRQPCPTGSFCQNHKNSEFTCVDIDECAAGTHTCLDGEKCTNLVGKRPYVCLNINECETGQHTCETEFETCLDLEPDVNDGKKFTCVDKNECQDGTHTCKSNQICRNQEKGYTCEIVLRRCEDENNQYCPVDGSRCVNIPSGIECVDVDECDDFIHDCTFDQECVNEDVFDIFNFEKVKYRCVEATTEEVISTTNPVTTTKKATTTAPKTTQKASTASTKFIPVNECETGLHQCIASEICIDTYDGYNCESKNCKNDQIGCNQFSRCEKVNTGNYNDIYEYATVYGDYYLSAEPDYTCVDIDECLENLDDCRDDQICINEKNGFTCLERRTTTEIPNVVEEDTTTVKITPAAIVKPTTKPVPNIPNDANCGSNLVSYFQSSPCAFLLRCYYDRYSNYQNICPSLCQSMLDNYQLSDCESPRPPNSLPDFYGFNSVKINANQTTCLCDNFDSRLGNMTSCDESVLIHPRIVCLELTQVVQEEEESTPEPTTTQLPEFDYVTDYEAYANDPELYPDQAPDDESPGDSASSSSVSTTTVFAETEDVVVTEFVETDSTDNFENVTSFPEYEGSASDSGF